MALGKKCYRSLRLKEMYMQVAGTIFSNVNLYNSFFKSFFYAEKYEYYRF